MKVDSKRIRDVRTTRAWSQEHLAEVSGLGLRTIQRIENGANASLESVAALSSVLEIPIIELVIKDEPKKRGFVQTLIDHRLKAAPVLIFVSAAVNPPHLVSSLGTLTAFWLACEAYLAVRAKIVSRS